ncbi:MAG: glucosaminidase domain-containing protein [Acetobacteraceae bacterium]|nr:glucosaminidase domain-containing protein [Acetobacteraceae bacterium]
MPLVPSPTILSTDEMGRVAPPIAASVGRDGRNDPKDVFVIQSLLNDRLPKPHSPVPVTGRADPGTTLAIEAYQAVVMSMLPPTGRVEPGSATYYALASRPLVEQPVLAMGHYGVLPQEVIDAALASRLHWRVPASVTLAQWVVESAWGAAVPPGSNNPFGIKAQPGEPAVESPTREVVDGADVMVTARFRRFGSLGEAFEQHGRLLATAVRYESAMKLASNPGAFADALTGVYATDPEYGYTLKWVMQTYGFTRYDQ